MCNLIDVAKTVGANRMVQTVSVPYPLGDPELSKEAEWQLRTSRVGAVGDQHGSFQTTPLQAVPPLQQDTCLGLHFQSLFLRYFISTPHPFPHQ